MQLPFDWGKVEYYYTVVITIYYILVGGLKVTYSYQVLGNDLDDVTNDVRDCPGGGPCYVLVHA